MTASSGRDHHGAAGALDPVLTALIGPAPVRFDLWDGSAWGAEDAPATIRLRSPDALRRVVWAPGELGIARAFVAEDLDVDGDIYEALRALRPAGRTLRKAWRSVPRATIAAKRLGVVGRPLPPPPEELRPHGRRHSSRRDAAVVGHHYDVGNDFYELVLGPSLTYSCARFSRAGMSLAEAQDSKHDLVCRKLGLQDRSGMRLLDVGCGWGSLALHAARTYGCRVVGVTISEQQLQAARRRVDQAGLGDQVDIRLQDYRRLDGEEFDAISSIGMSEHVGHERIDEYFAVLRSLLVPGGRMLNHAISAVGSSRIGRRTFMGRYVFPDGELLDVADTVSSMERVGFEVRDVEGLREHYAVTLRAWVANLEQHWDDAVALVGVRRARVWRLYMAASAIGFEDGGLGVHQVLGVVPAPTGASGMPPTRDDWATG